MTISCLTTEAQRLDALHKLNILDTPPSEAFDRITRMAARLFNLPIAAVSLTDTDRQWFKSRVGVEHNAIPRLKAPCGNVADNSDLLIIPDLHDDAYFCDSPLAASGIRYYAGAPLVTADGHCLGAMCVLGTEPRDTTPEELTILCDLAAMVMSQIEIMHALGRVDSISGLPNRNQFIEDFQDMQRDSEVGAQRVAVLINLATPAQLAHAVRAMNPRYLDELVTDAATWIRTELGAGRKVYHVATTQFAILTTPEMAIDRYPPLLEAKLEHAIATVKTRFVATPSIGVVPFDISNTDALSVLRRAQSAVQDAIESGTSVAMYSAGEDQVYRRRFNLLNDFGAALERPGQLRLVFQPRIDIASGECVGAEALLRWNHPTLGAIGPGEFMPIVERSRLAQAATSWVLNTALDQQLAWRHAGLVLQLSLNVSALNLLEADFADRVVEGLQRRRLPHDCLELEITESAIMEHPTKAHATLDALAHAGIHLAIDDFGTGYSSLAYLQRMPADVVKIDQSFVRGIEHDQRQQGLVRAMISLSQELGHRVVAEGVENGAALAFLRSAGCDEAQGYLFAKPLEVADFARWHLAQAAQEEAPTLNMDSALEAVERAFAMRVPRLLCTTPSPRILLAAARRRPLIR